MENGLSFLMAFMLEEGYSRISIRPRGKIAMKSWVMDRAGPSGRRSALPRIALRSWPRPGGRLLAGRRRGSGHVGGDEEDRNDEGSRGGGGCALRVAAGDQFALAGEARGSEAGKAAGRRGGRA